MPSQASPTPPTPPPPPPPPGQGPKTHAVATGGGSALKRYQDLIVGSRSLGFLLYFEFCSWLALVPGAAGIFLRKLFWPRLFGACGPGCVFGRGIVLRHPQRIRLGARVVISENCILDARHSSLEEVLTIGDDGNLSNNVMISCKEGQVRIGRHAGIGAGSIIHSTHHNPVELGDDVILGPMCYLAGGGNYDTSDPDQPIRTRPIRRMGGIRIADNVWLAARVTVLDGVQIGTGSIAAAGAVINRQVPEYAVCAGVPAKVVAWRKETAHAD